MDPIELFKKSPVTIARRYEQIFSNPTIVGELQAFAPEAADKIHVKHNVDNLDIDSLPTTDNDEIKSLYALKIMQIEDRYEEGDQLLGTQLVYGTEPGYEHRYPIGMVITVGDRVGGITKYLFKGAREVHQEIDADEVIEATQDIDILTQELSLATWDGFRTLSADFVPYYNSGRKTTR